MTDIQKRLKTRLMYSRLIERVERVFERIAMDQFVVSEPFTAVLDKIYKNGPQLLGFITEPRKQEYSLARNAVDTAILSFGIAQSLELVDLSPSTITTLMLGALLHDVGMFCIPQSIFTTKDLAKNEQRCIFVHPIHGYNVIIRDLHYHNRIGLVALQHHEYWNGTGYPQGLSGTAITLESRIVAIGDAFAAMIAPRAYRASLTGHQAMNQLINRINIQFDPKLLNAFVSLMGSYPQGSLVRLNTGAIAQVIDQTTIPLKPRIRILTNKFGEPCIDEEEYNLTEKVRLFITGEAERKDVV
jgi:HD-GYP domain-containing protein (c-di-GMP phosphodiesterase class II)